ncbi:MAG: hypothetical protein KU29_09890 [Sulfurovum sp. FS06-10]|jgi:hypothetical protein|nr:MAG: hypothetical protein KU29_09890 [Sulfurovum sp. FS06-10]
MKKIIVMATTLTWVTTALCALELGNIEDIDVESGKSFNKVMSKNRSSKNIAGSNFVEIKNSDDLEAQGKKDLGVTIDSSKRVGTVYNYVDIKNAKVTKDNFTEGKSRVTNKYNSQNAEDEGRNIGVKVKVEEGFNRGFKGKVHNNVKIENSELD